MKKTSKKKASVNLSASFIVYKPIEENLKKSRIVYKRLNSEK